MKKLLAVLMCMGLLVGLGGGLVGCKTETKKAPAAEKKAEEKKAEEKKAEEKKEEKKAEEKKPA